MDREKQLRGDWIPITRGLSRRREVLILAERFKKSRFWVVGILVEFWSWASRESSDGHIPAITPKSVASIIGGTQTFWRGLEQIGWAVFGENGLRIPNFEYWLSQSTKKRLTKNLRQSRWRNKDKNVDTDVDAMRSTSSHLISSSYSSSSLKNLEEAKEGLEASQRNGVADRWNDKISDLLKAPKIRSMSKTRCKRLQARLREIPDLWDLIEAEASQIGSWAREQAFLTFDWILSPTNLTKFLEGNYREKKNNKFSDEELRQIAEEIHAQ